MSISIVGLLLFVADCGEDNTWLAIGRHLAGIREKK
jgi:hypothetical protein